jgi:hypothetical protein
MCAYGDTAADFVEEKQHAYRRFTDRMRATRKSCASNVIEIMCSGKPLELQSRYFRETKPHLGLDLHDHGRASCLGKRARAFERGA